MCSCRLSWICVQSKRSAARDKPEVSHYLVIDGIVQAGDRRDMASIEAIRLVPFKQSTIYITKPTNLIEPGTKVSRVNKTPFYHFTSSPNLYFLYFKVCINDLEK